MDQLIEIVLGHKPDFRIYNPMPAFEEMLELRDRKSIPPTPEGLFRLTAETMDLVTTHHELPQYLVFMDLFHSDVISRIEPGLRGEALAITRNFLLQFPRGAYNDTTRIDEGADTDHLRDKYDAEFALSRKELGKYLFPHSLGGYLEMDEQLASYIRTVFALHEDYRGIVSQVEDSQTRLTKDYQKAHPGIDMYALGGGENIGFLTRHRYVKSVPYFMNDSDITGAYGPGFKGLSGIFYPVSKKCHGLVDKLWKEKDPFSR